MERGAHPLMIARAMRRSVAVFAAAALAAAAASLAVIQPEGIGVVHGANHAFSLKAPSGWMLDNQSGVDQGLAAVFYPQGGKWDSSKVVAYARVRTWDDNDRTVKDHVSDTLKRLRAENPNYAGRKIRDLKLDDGRVAEIYYFEGDRWGNFEAAAYIPEKKTLNFVVMSARTGKLFRQYLPAFEELVHSYLFMGDKPLDPSERDKFAPKKAE